MIGAATRLEALADVAGGCELPLTRAVIGYREGGEVEGAGGGTDDIGLALVLDGEYAASAEALDLGSGRVRHVELGTELVVLDWVFEATLHYVRTLLRTAPEGGHVPGPLLQYAQGIALSVLRRVGFSALTRPILLRIGYRDVVRDLDPNEHAVVRIAGGPGERIEARFECDHNTLLVERPGEDAAPRFERLLLAAFPAADVRRIGGRGRTRYQLRFPLPLSLRELRGTVDQVRSGLLGLYERIEPERYRALRRGLDVFGPRDTLGQLERWEHVPEAVRLRAPRERLGSDVA